MALTNQTAMHLFVGLCDSQPSLQSLLHKLHKNANSIFALPYIASS